MPKVTRLGGISSATVSPPPAVETPEPEDHSFLPSDAPMPPVRASKRTAARKATKPSAVGKKAAATRAAKKAAK